MYKFQILFKHLPFVALSLVSAGLLALWIGVMVRENKETSPKSKTLLLVFGVAVLIRILKWFHSFLPEALHIPYWNLCFAIQTLLGPLSNLYLYFQLNKSAVFKAYDGLHGLPFLLMLIFIGQYNSMLWHLGGTEVVILATYWVAHSVVGGIIIHKYRYEIQEMEPTEKDWILIFYWGNVAMSLAYLMYSGINVVSDTVFSIVLMVTVFGFSLYYIRRDRNKKSKNKKERKLIEKEFLKDKMNQFLEEKSYLNTNLTLQKMADSLNVPAYLLSNFLNDNYNQSFPDFINRLRIEKAAEMLLDPRFLHYKISSIASDCGFNTLSAFNIAFKKFKNCTPSEFRQKNTQ